MLRKLVDVFLIFAVERSNVYTVQIPSAAIDIFVPSKKSPRLPNAPNTRAAAEASAISSPAPPGITTMPEQRYGLLPETCTPNIVHSTEDCG